MPKIGYFRKKRRGVSTTLAFYSQVGMTNATNSAAITPLNQRQCARVLSLRASITPSAHHSVSDALAAKPKDEPSSTASQAGLVGSIGANLRCCHTFSNT
jgi:hypothetical protein